MKKDSLFSAFKKGGMEIPKNEQLNMKGGQGDPQPCELEGAGMGKHHRWHSLTENEWQTEDSNTSTGWHTDCGEIIDCSLCG